MVPYNSPLVKGEFPCFILNKCPTITITDVQEYSKVGQRRETDSEIARQLEIVNSCFNGSWVMLTTSY